MSETGESEGRPKPIDQWDADDVLQSIKDISPGHRDKQGGLAEGREREEVFSTITKISMMRSVLERDDRLGEAFEILQDKFADNRELVKEALENVVDKGHFSQADIPEKLKEWLAS